MSSQTRSSTRICADGDHDPAWDPDAGATVCRNCGYRGTTIVNAFGHDLY